MDGEQRAGSSRAESLNRDAEKLASVGPPGESALGGPQRSAVRQTKAMKSVASRNGRGRGRVVLGLSRRGDRNYSPLPAEKGLASCWGLCFSSGAEPFS